MKLPIIARYNDDLKKYLKAKTKPEGWMHCIMYDKAFAIYVWDTREVIEQGKCKMPNTIADVHLDFAVDNLTPLVGDNKLNAGIDAMNKLQKYADKQGRKLASLIITANSITVNDVLCKQSIYSASRFDNERYYVTSIVANCTSRKSFKKTEVYNSMLVRIFPDGDADMHSLSDTMPEYQPDEYNEIVKLIGELGYSIKEAEVYRGYTPLPLH